MHHPGIEPGSHRWQRCILPLDQWCDQQGLCHCGVNNTVARRVSDRGSNLPTQNRQHLVGCRKLSLRDSIVVSISACHADDPGSIPGRGAFPFCEPLPTSLPKWGTRSNEVWHHWSSGRIHRCHRCDPGSIPGWCMCFGRTPICVVGPRVKTYALLCTAEGQSNVDCTRTGSLLKCFP